MKHRNTEVAQALSAIEETVTYLWTKGWAERNAGNISHNLTSVWDAKFRKKPVHRTVAMPGLPLEAEGMILYITGTGRRLRELTDASKGGAIVQFWPSLQVYEILWGGGNDADFKITSEASSHVQLHIDLVKRKSLHSCVLHTHPPALICLSHHPALGKDEYALTDSIWKMIPEVRAFVPRGVGIVPYHMPGSDDLAKATKEKLREFDVALWSMHGATASGLDALDAFDFLDVAEKGARLLLDSWAAGFEPCGLSIDEQEKMAKKFGLAQRTHVDKSSGGMK